MTRDDKIVSMTRADGATDPDRARLESHWRDIGGARDIPRRADIDPAAIAPCLDRIVLIERIAPRQARIRLAGQRVAGLAQHDLRGMPLSTLVIPPARDWLGEATEALFDDPARIELGLTGPRSTFRARTRAALTLLPLRDNDGMLNRAVGFLTLPPRAPGGQMRFDICGETRRILGQAEQVETAFVEPDDVAPFAEADRARDVLRRRRQFHVVS